MRLIACCALLISASNSVPRDVVVHVEADLVHLEVLEAQAAHARRHAAADIPNMLPFQSDGVSAMDILRHAQQMAEGTAKEALQVFVERASAAAQKPSITPTLEELTLATWTFGNVTLFVQHALQYAAQRSPPHSQAEVGRMEDDGADHKEAARARPVKAARAPADTANGSREAQEERTHTMSVHVATNEDVLGPHVPAKAVPGTSAEDTAPMVTPHAGRSSEDAAPGARQADASNSTGARRAETPKTTELLQHPVGASTDMPAAYKAWTPNATAVPVKSTLSTFDFGDDGDDTDDDKPHKRKWHSTHSFIDKSLSSKISKEGIQKHHASKQQRDTTTDFIANLYDSEGHLPQAYTTWQPTDDTPKTSPSIEAMKAALADDDASLLQVNHLRGTTNYRHQAASILLEAYSSALHSEALHELSKRFKHQVSPGLIKHLKQITAMQRSGRALSDDTLPVLPTASPEATKAWLLCQYFRTREAPRVTEQRRALIKSHDAQVYQEEQIAAFARMQTKTTNLPAFSTEAAAWREKMLTLIDTQQAPAHKALKEAQEQFAQENDKAAPLRTHLERIRVQCGQFNVQAKREREVLELRAMNEALELIGAH
eukprot:GEMP01033841.1.p1 GENE.GEMP01033841.1~~GEMP01033841.1.p1  ORF type:complete len:603 (+),score=206.23 GEMP01033841.1:281-2089(+)